MAYDKFKVYKLSRDTSVYDGAEMSIGIASKSVLGTKCPYILRHLSVVPFLSIRNMVTLVGVQICAVLPRFKKFVVSKLTSQQLDWPRVGLFVNCQVSHKSATIFGNLLW